MGRSRQDGSGGSEQGGYGRWDVATRTRSVLPVETPAATSHQVRQWDFGGCDMAGRDYTRGKRAPTKQLHTPPKQLCMAPDWMPQLFRELALAGVLH